MLNRIRGTLNLADLAARAATLGERLAQAGLAAPHHDAVATARLDRWTRVVSGSDPERPFTQIAELLGKSPSAVKMTHYRALRHVRRAMEADGFTSAASLLGGPNDA